MAANDVPLPPDVDWATITQHIPPYEEVIKTIKGWAAGSARPFASMPRPTEPDYARRMREAYNSTLDSIRNIQKGPDSRATGMVLGQMWVQANGFASRIKVGGADFDPDQGADHVLAGLPAIIAGRYWQIREREEGEIGMDALADLEAKFEEQAFRPSHEEIDMCWDHALEVEERSPDNPVNPKLFTESRWKALQKAGLVVAEKVTKERNGQLSMDPATMEAQLLAFEKEIIELGWAVQGKESCRILWGMLTPEHRSVLQHTNCFLALKKEKFTDEHNMPATSGFSSIVPALRTHFGGNDSIRPVGSNLASDYFQHPKETLRAFLERIKRCFIQDLNTEWYAWPRAQRRNLITRFLRGMVKEDFDHTSTPKDRDALAEKSWPALMLIFIEVDRVIGPRARRFV